MLASRSVDHVHPDLSHAPKPPPTVRIAFADYVDLIWSGTAEARNFFVIGDNIPLYDYQSGMASDLVRDLNIPGVIDPARLRFIGLWLSAQGSASRLHYDANGCHNLNGRKNVIMFTPDSCDLIYPYLRTATDTSFGQFSQVDVFEPDLERFPRYALAGSWRGTLEPGDALFIPAYWYHAFKHEGDVNLNVNFWWLPERQLVNGITIREALLAALAKDVLGDRARGDVASIVRGLGGDIATLINQLELALLSPRVPGRSERP